MSILNVDKIQPIGGGSTITVDATDIQATSATITATTFSGNIGGTPEFSGDLTIPQWIIHAGDTDTKLGFPSADAVDIFAGGKQVRITSDGHLGINRTTPAAPITARRLDAGGTGTSGVIAEFANSSGYGVWFGQSSASGASWGATTGDFYWCTGGLSSQTERLRIDSSGRVLIGTTTEGAVQAGNVTVSGTGDVGVTFRSTNSGTNRIFFSDATSGAGEYAGYINYDHSSNLMVFGTNESTRVRITSTGLFGIGVTPISIFHVRPLDETNFLVRNEGSTVVLASETNSGRDNNRAMALEASHFEFIEGGSEKVRIDSSGRVLIGSTAKAGDSALQVYTSDLKHPAIRTNASNANGYTLLSDAYNADESQVNIGVSYSSASLVLSRSCKVSDTADDAFLSSQDSYSTRPSALKLDEEGALSFWTTETNSTRTTDSAVSLTEVFSIDRVGNIRQKISSRYMYFGANQELQIGVNGSDPYVNAASGDLMIRDAGNGILNVRSDGIQMYQDIYFATAGKGIVLGATSNVDSNTLDDYEEGTFTPVFNGSDGGGTSRSGTGKYTKVGNLVNVWVDLSNANGSGFGSGYMKVSGLPFTCTQQSWTTNIWTYNVAFNTSRLQNFHMPSSSTVCNGYYSVNDSSWQPWYVSEWDATQIYCRFQLTYLAS